MAKKKRTTTKKSSVKPKTPRTKKPEIIEEFMEIGDSPAPGITLQNIIVRDKENEISSIAWSPDGQHLSSLSSLGKIHIWETFDNHLKLTGEWYATDIDSKSTSEIK